MRTNSAGCHTPRFPDREVVRTLTDERSVPAAGRSRRERMVPSPVGKHDEPQTPNDPSKDGASPNPNPTIPKAPDPGKHEQK
jgi:hypothetical protein